MPTLLERFRTIKEEREEEEVEEPEPFPYVSAKVIYEPVDGQPNDIEQRKLVGQMLIHGYSAAAIAHRYKTTFNEDLDRTWLERIHRKVWRSGKIRKIQEIEEALILTSGLARKAERVRRLADYVDTIELMAVEEPKWGTEWRRAISQIHEEVGPLGIDSGIEPEHPYYKILQEILEVEQQRVALLGSAESGERVPDPERIGGEAE